MLTIIREGQGKDGRRDESDWYVGQTQRYTPTGIQGITFIEADNGELEHIKDIFAVRDLNGTTLSYSIPMPAKKQVVTWYGDIAKIIVASL